MEHPHPLFPKLPNYHPDPVDGVKIGQSPIAGITLKRILNGHDKWIGGIAWSPNGKYLASPSADHSIGIWDVTKGSVVRSLIGHQGSTHCIAWGPNGQLLVSGSEDKTLRIWKASGMHQQTLEGHLNTIAAVAYSPNGRFLASASYDSTIRLWNKNGKYLNTIRRHSDGVLSLAWSPNGKYLASGSYDATCRIWDIQGKQIHLLKGHSSSVCSVAWSQDGKLLVTTSSDSTIRIWDTHSGINLQVLEGHIGRVNSAMFSTNGHFLASKGGDKDNAILIWRCDTWDFIGRIHESSSRFLSPALAFHPSLLVLATLGEEDKTIRVWELDEEVLLKQKQTSIQYTTAKIVLVGDSGVGKTGLGWRLVHHEFKAHSSTHGQQFWVLDDLRETLSDGTLCEAILWDFAGQPDYRLVHSLFLDDVDIALVLFDSSNRENPLGGVKFWINQLKINKNKCSIFLVGARKDRGMVPLTKTEILSFCKQNGIKGGYYSTSALTEEGIKSLIKGLKASIIWSEMRRTTTTETFKQIKEYVLELKENSTRNNLLKNPADLYKELQYKVPALDFSLREMMTAVGHLKNHGYVNVLTCLTDAGYVPKILLNPDELINVASSIVLKARSDIKGLGVIEERRLVSDGYLFPELMGLDETERKLLLGAASELFIQNNLCFRERLTEETLLVFPSLIHKKRPREQAAVFKEGAFYHIVGPIENIYALLVVRFGYTNTFRGTELWQNLAQFSMGKGEVCRFMQDTAHEGEIELVLSFAKDTSEDTQLLFQGLVERFLQGRELTIKRYLPVICPECDTQMARVVLKAQLDRKKEQSFCHECGERLNLPSVEAITHLQTNEERKIEAEVIQVEYRTKFETALSRAKALHFELGRGMEPVCYICYDRRSKKTDEWALQFNKDLRNAGIETLFDPRKRMPEGEKRWDVEEILSCDFVIIIGTPSLKKKSQKKDIRDGLETELELIDIRMQRPLKYRNTLIPILIKGNPETSFPTMLGSLPNIDFRNKETYFFLLLKTIWRILNLPFDIPAWDEISGPLNDKNLD